MQRNNPSGNPHGVGVIIVNYQSEAYLKIALKCLSAQTLPPQSVVVVNNGDDVSLLPLKKEYPAVVFLEPGGNLGFAGANNLGAKHLTLCRYIAFLNPDAFPRENWLEKLVETAEKNPDAAMFGSRMLCLSLPLKTDGTGDVYHFSGLVFRKKHGKKPDAHDLVKREIFSPCAAAAMVKTSAFFEAGGFDEDYFCYSEDVDLGFRIRLLGHAALYAPEAVVYHMGSAVTGRRSPFSIYFGHRNIVWTYVKNMPPLWFFLFLPFHILLNMISLFWFAGRGRGKIIIKAKLDALKSLCKVFKKRKIVQKQRRLSNIGVLKLLTYGVNIIDRFK